MDKCILSEKEKLDSHSCFAEQDTNMSVPSRSDETVPVAWEEISNTTLPSHAKGNFLLNETDSLNLFQLSKLSNFKRFQNFDTFLSFRIFPGTLVTEILM